MVTAPDTIKSGLDEVFYDGFEMDKQPGEVRADDELFFRQGDTPWGIVQYAESMGPGDYRPHAEDEEVDEASVRVDNKTSVEVLEFDKDIAIPQRYQEDSEMYGTVEEWVNQLGIRGRTTRDKYAFRNTYGDAFSGVTTPDGVALVSNSHVSLKGSTVDNLETGAMTADNLATLVRRLRLMPAQDGDLASYHADGLLCPSILHPTATEITKSELKAGTMDNDLNYWSLIYPGLKVGSSEYLDSDYNSLNTNADTSYFVVSKMHNICRKVRKELAVDYIGPEYDRKRRAFYRARFREITYAGTWGGLVGSNGTTA